MEMVCLEEDPRANLVCTDLSATDTSGRQQTTYNDAQEQHVIYKKTKTITKTLTKTRTMTETMTSLPLTPVAGNKPLIMMHQSNLLYIQEDNENYKDNDKDKDKDNDKTNDLSPTDTSGRQKNTFSDAPVQHVIYTRR